MTNRKGIRRHEALQPLSRHHMMGLHVGLKLSRAGTEESNIPTEQIIEDAMEFWCLGGQEHFREEEEVLLPAYALYEDIHQPDIVEMLLEHVLIRSGMDELCRGKISEEQMGELGELLHGHIRKEERILFPMIEEALPEEKLQELAPYLHD